MHQHADLTLIPDSPANTFATSAARRPAPLRLGEILVEQKVLTREQLGHLLDVQAVNRRPLGDLAERLYGVSARAVEDAWVTQYVARTGTCDTRDVTADPATLALLDRRQAWQFQIVPLRQDEGGIVALTSPQHLVRAVNFASRSFGMPVSFVLTDEASLANLLMHHYPVPPHIAAYATRR